VAHLGTELWLSQMPHQSDPRQIVLWAIMLLIFIALIFFI
jgi:hypothetical protein